MRKLLPLAALFLAQTSSAAQDLSPRAAYRDACALSRYTCKDIPQPMIRESIFVDKANAFGFYFGGRTIWLSTFLTPVERYVVMVHEMVHYLQCHEDRKCFPQSAPFETCLREEEAYEVSDRVIRRLGDTGRLTERLSLLRKHCG